MRMIPAGALAGNLFSEARRHAHLPVVMLAATAFRIPPAARGESEHLVRADSADALAGFTCTCGSVSGCWAMARAFEVMQLLGEHRIFVSRGESPMPRAGGPRRPAEELSQAAVYESGEMELLFNLPPPAEAAARVLAG